MESHISWKKQTKNRGAGRAAHSIYLLYNLQDSSSLTTFFSQAIGRTELHLNDILNLYTAELFFCLFFSIIMSRSIANNK